MFKKFFKKIGEGLKKIGSAIVNFVKEHAKPIMKHVCGAGIDIIIFGIFDVLYKNKSLCAAFGINLGPVGVAIAVAGTFGLSIVASHMIDHYIDEEMDDFLGGLA